MYNYIHELYIAICLLYAHMHNLIIVVKKLVTPLRVLVS